MQKRTRHKGICRVVASCMLMMIALAGFHNQPIIAEAVEMSEVNYNVFLNGDKVFISNEKTIGSEVGTEYYLTYTVKSVTENPAQHGLIGTGDYTQRYPYQNGGLLRGSNHDKHLLDEGATYFVKFTVAEGGFHYNVARVKDDTKENLYMEMVYGEGTAEMKYFGMWFGATKAQAELTNVRCYDVNGNDLGVHISSEQGLVLDASKPLKNAKNVQHRYDIVVDKQADIAISNLRVPIGSKVYMEYEVESAEHTFNQEGIILSTDPQYSYPYLKGMMKYNNYPEGNASLILLEVGAKYIISMERTEAGFDAYVQKTKNGVTSVHIFTRNTENVAEKQADYFSISFGTSQTGSFKLTNFKCYDANYNNLAVQCNKAAKIEHYGLMEDYAGCEATYYCKENGKSFALYKDQKFKFSEDNTTKDGTYFILDGVMTTKLGGKTAKYDYLFKRITDDEKNVYERLYNYTVTFVTGTEEKIESQQLSNKTGYFAMKPDNPKMEGYEFEGWCLSDGTTYEFDKIVTESTTLYAKYSGDGGVTFLAGLDEDGTIGIQTTDILLIVAGAVILLGGLAVCIWLAKKGQKNGQINSSN